MRPQSPVAMPRDKGTTDFMKPALLNRLLSRVFGFSKSAACALGRSFR